MGTCTGSKDYFWGVMVDFAIVSSCSQCGIGCFIFRNQDLVFLTYTLINSLSGRDGGASTESGEAMDW